MKLISRLLVFALLAVTPAHASYVKPKILSIQRLTSTGTTAGWVFVASGGGTHTANVGATYTNNGNTYTVLATFSGVAGIRFWASNSSAPSTPTGTLTKATGTGDATINYTVAPVAYATYTVPTPAPLYLKFLIVGGGSGGVGGGVGPGTPGAGTYSSFGPGTIAVANGGGLASVAASATGEVNTLTYGFTVRGLAGGRGSYDGVAGGASSVSTQAGGKGCSTALSGGGNYHLAAAIANTGSGGAGGSFTNNGAGNGGSGTGGSCGTLITGYIMNPVAGATYPYTVGVKGTGGTAGTGGASEDAGADGADGQIEVFQGYQ